MLSALSFNPIEQTFYLSEDVVELSQKLLGKVLVTQNTEGELTAGIISETEAYKGPEDMASHAYNGRRTPRNEVMYAEGGRAYVYLCYGIHCLFNVVTHIQNSPHAVLIRSVIPLIGIEYMQKRRKNKVPISVGPGLVCQAFGITLEDNGASLTENRIWIEDHGIEIPKSAIVCAKRIGIEYAKEHANLLWRFILSKEFNLTF